MKYLALIILLLPGFVSACVIGPKKLSANTDNGFTYKTENSDLCDNCNLVTITAPTQHNNQSFSHGLFTLYKNNNLLSRSIHSSINETGQPEFAGIIRGNKNIHYEITFEYGKGRCTSFNFVYTTIETAHNKAIKRD